MFVVVVHFNKIISLSSHIHICMRTHTSHQQFVWSCCVFIHFMTYKMNRHKKVSNSNNNIKNIKKLTVILYISEIQNQPCTQDSIFTHSISIQPVKKNQPLQHVDTLSDTQLTYFIFQYQAQSLQYQTHCS